MWAGWILVSIHALREEGDLYRRGRQHPAALFLSTPSARRATQAEGAGGTRPTVSIHALREEGDLNIRLFTAIIRCFYPRPPRGGRRLTPRPPRCARCFYPRPPRGGRPTRYVPGAPAGAVSIHALREEGDCRGSQRQRRGCRFLSTPSARRATSQHVTFTSECCCFYPRPPRGGRPAKRTQNLA